MACALLSTSFDVPRSKERAPRLSPRVVQCVLPLYRRYWSMILWGKSPLHWHTIRLICVIAREQTLTVAADYESTFPLEWNRRQERTPLESDAIWRLANCWEHWRVSKATFLTLTSAISCWTAQCESDLGQRTEPAELNLACRLTWRYLEMSS